MIEFCVGSYEDSLKVSQLGAKQIELNSALSLGGLSPSLSVLKRIKKETDLIVNCMVRPRAAGFFYSKYEKQIIFDEAKLFLENGADGIVFGFLNEDGTIDTLSTKDMVSFIHSYQKTAIFHRAFDCTSNPFEAMETLIDCGVDRVLTSGQMPTASEGKDCLKGLNQRYGEQIQILMGSGVNAQNASELMAYTGIKNIHSSCLGIKEDPTTTTSKVSFSYLKGNGYESMNLEKVKELLNV